MEKDALLILDLSKAWSPEAREAAAAARRGSGKVSDYNSARRDFFKLPREAYRRFDPWNEKTVSRLVNDVELTLDLNSEGELERPLTPSAVRRMRSFVTKYKARLAE